MQSMIEVDLSAPNPSKPFEYCLNSLFMANVGQCAYCYSLIDSQKFLASFLNTLQLGCEEQPLAGDVLTPSPLPFSNNPAVTSSGNVVLATSAVGSSSSGGSNLPLAAKAGIAIGILVVFLLLVCVLTVYIIRKRRVIKRRQRMSPYWAGHPNVPSPSSGAFRHSAGFSPHSAGLQSPPFTPYSPYQPYMDYAQSTDTSPISPLQRSFYPKGFSEHRISQLEHAEYRRQSQIAMEQATAHQLAQKLAQEQQYELQQRFHQEQQQQQYGEPEYVDPDSKMKLKVETTWDPDSKHAHEEEWAPLSADTPQGKEVSPQSFS